MKQLRIIYLKISAEIEKLFCNIACNFLQNIHCNFSSKERTRFFIYYYASFNTFFCQTLNAELYSLSQTYILIPRKRDKVHVFLFLFLYLQAVCVSMCQQKIFWNGMNVYILFQSILCNNTIDLDFGRRHDYTIFLYVPLHDSCRCCYCAACVVL